MYPINPIPTLTASHATVDESHERTSDGEDQKEAGTGTAERDGEDQTEAETGTADCDGEDEWPRGRNSGRGKAADQVFTVREGRLLRGRAGVEGSSSCATPLLSPTQVRHVRKKCVEAATMWVHLQEETGHRVVFNRVRGFLVGCQERIGSNFSTGLGLRQRGEGADAGVRLQQLPRVTRDGEEDGEARRGRRWD